MFNTARIFTILIVLFTTGSCNKVGFKAEPKSTAAVNAADGNNGGGGGGPGGPGGTDPTGGTGCIDNTCNTTPTYGWHQSGFGLCSKPCGTGDQAQIVDCRRSNDNVVVADSFCTGTKPVAARVCNVQACASAYTWNFGDYGACSVTCGGGVQTRPVTCQDQSGNVVPNGNCSAAKPATSAACNTSACGNTSYAWLVTTVVCPQTCANTQSTATDTAVCLANNGTVVGGGYCGGAAPVVTHQCNQNACPQTYTYAWVPGNFSDCSRTCGGGVQTRSIACQRSDGFFVDGGFCDPAAKPAAQNTCNTNACGGGGTRQVTQTATVPPAANAVDVILIVDDSSSMADDQAKLAKRMGTLLTNLDAQNVDYQVCLTTTDVSYYAGSPIKWLGLGNYIMTSASPNKNQVFIDTINSLGAEWSSDERAIDAVYLMIQNFRQSGCIRDKAALTTIVISDEDERSVGGDQSLSKAQYQPLETGDVPANLTALVHKTFDAPPFVKPFTWNSIIDIPGDTACMALQNQDVSPSFWGKLYAQLSGSTGGAVGSICDSDYTQNLTFIKDRIVNSLPSIVLQCAPIGSPQVVLNPTFTTSVTTSGNTLVFTPALPQNTQVTLNYVCPN